MGEIHSVRGGGKTRTTRGSQRTKTIQQILNQANDVALEARRAGQTNRLDRVRSITERYFNRMADRLGVPKGGKGYSRVYNTQRVSDRDIPFTRSAYAGY